MKRDEQNHIKLYRRREERKIVTHAKTLRAVAAALLLVWIAGCRQSPRAARPAVRVAAASDLRFALDELLAAFRRERPDVDVSVSYGSSGTFYAQLLNGAPFDVFLSADLSYPRQLEERQLVVPQSAFAYGVGRLVIWVPAASTLDVERQGLRALADPAIAHVAIANPAHAPYGRAAEAALRSAGVYDAVKSKLVLGESVSQALQFVQSGAADAGVVALSLALSPTVGAQGRYAAVPLDLYPRMDQGGVVMRAAGDRDAAMAFRTFMLAAPARGVLKRFGFFLPAS
jgi:molybdate transport system substrate-binding protein